MIVWKQIRPSKLKSEALINELMAEIKVIAREIERDFRATTATWKHKPQFETLAGIGPQGPELLIATDDEIYRFVSGGTKPHPIYPVFAKALRFRSGYIAKTKPGWIGSMYGGPHGQVVFSGAVEHPGTEAREFEKLIQKKWQPRFKQRMEAAMRRAAKASGHGM